ncbi:MAG: phosphate ABC transporter permease PstA [Proteobacteria bacterium]|nr:phosphate ABC transporter permease PstA [Pseudomonadota bacterium]MBU1709163.1 phosphate ABC transporter permease PstA [Pseudomonadota bacterium]
MNREITEKIIIMLIRAVAYLIVILVGYILYDIIRKGAPNLSWEFISGFPEQSGAKGGILPAIVGTLCLVGGTIAIALPLGVGSAIYLSEYAKPNRFTEIIRLAIVTLAGVPSIVFGLFGLGLFVIFLGFGASILSGSLTLACMVLPTIIVASEEALRAVPRGFRAASLALGATKWETIRTNVLPYSLSGMITGSILAIGRAAGETAPILLTVAAFFLPTLPKSIYDQVMALPYHLYILATQHPAADQVRPMQYGTALVLLIIVLGLSLGAIIIRIYYRRKYQW